MHNIRLDSNKFIKEKKKSSLVKNANITMTKFLMRTIFLNNT